MESQSNIKSITNTKIRGISKPGGRGFRRRLSLLMERERERERERLTKKAASGGRVPPLSARRWKRGGVEDAELGRLPCTTKKRRRWRAPEMQHKDIDEQGGRRAHGRRRRRPGSPLSYVVR
jgi:hypothetical protein